MLISRFKAAVATLLLVGLKSSANATAIEQQSKLPELLDATLEQLRHGLDHGHFTSVNLVDAYIARISEVNQALHAVTEVNPDARAIAARLDKERQEGKACPSPLHGIPILIKNNIATNDKMNNTAGSYALLGAKVPQDSPTVVKLRKAGAIILGKANLSQWANFRSFNTSNGWSAYGGQTKGAYFRDQDPSGSSSGSGVAASIGLAWATLGTETYGSIISPSENNNLAGIKPTVGLTSRYLVVPISEHQDTVGPMARTLKDAAHLLTAIAGSDPHDNYTSAIPFRKIPNYAAACRGVHGLKGKRLGVEKGIYKPDAKDPVSVAFAAALNTLREAGAEIVQNVMLPGLAELDNQTLNPLQLLEADMYTNIVNKYLVDLATNPNNITSLEGLDKFTQQHPLEEYPKRDTNIWKEAVALGFNNTSQQFYAGYTKLKLLSGEQGLLGALKNNSLDALVYPAQDATIAAAILGCPVVTVPMGKTPADTPYIRGSFDVNIQGPNQPFGIAFIGKHWSEESLIEMAHAYEQKTQIRTSFKPMTIPKTELKDVKR